MASRSHMTALGLDGDRLLAVRMLVGAGRVRVKRALAVRRPEDVPGTDATKVGEWAAGVLKENGLAGGRVVLAARRDEVVLKRIGVPRAAGLHQGELAGLVRLAMSRQMTLAVEGAGIDFVPLSGHGGDAEMPVIAAAMPGDRVAWHKRFAGSAGVKATGLELAVGGVAALVAEMSIRRGGPVLGISLGHGAVEFALVEGGVLTFARSVEAPRPGEGDDIEAYAARVVVETRRTWMGSRAGQDAGGLELISVLGSDALAERVRARCADASLASGTEVAGLPGAVEVEPEVRADELGPLLPLIGLGVRAAAGMDGFDFLRVRKTRDPKAKRRELVLASMFLAIIAAGALWVAADRALAGLRGQRDAARSQAQKLSGQYADLLIREARASSVEHWTRARVDWLGHMRWLSDQMPDPKLGLLDDVSASMSADVAVAPRDRTPAGAQWTTRQEAVFSLSGKVSRRDVALDLRGRLVRGDVYRVINQTADTEDKFSFDLITSRRSPEEQPPAPAAPAQAKPGGAS